MSSVFVPKKNILIIDDEEFYLNLLRHHLEDKHHVIATNNGEHGLELARGDVKPDLILLDIMMPDLDGFEVCKQLKQDPATCDIPVLFITVLDDHVDEAKGLELGAEDYISKPLSLDIVLARVKTHLALHDALKALEQQNQLLEEEVKLQIKAYLREHDRLEAAQSLGRIGNWELNLETGSLYWSKQIYDIFGVDPESFEPSYKSFIQAIHPEDRKRVEASFQHSAETGEIYDIVHRIVRKSDGEIRYVQENSTQELDAIGNPLRSLGTVQDITERVLLENESLEYQYKIENAFRQTIQAVASTVEKRDPYTAGHQRKVALLAANIAEELGFSDDRIEGIRLGATIHDIGKIQIPAEILNRPGRLSDAEFLIIKQHPKHGVEILEGIEFPWPIATMIGEHHERIDGSGYPDGLSGEEISDEAKIIAVADVIEAMSTHRPYRPSLGIKLALEEIRNGRGTKYDAAVVDACLKIFKEKGFQFASDTSFENI